MKSIVAALRFLRTRSIGPIDIDLPQLGDDLLALVSTLAGQVTSSDKP